MARCYFKVLPEDFRVDEELPFEPDGEGEHQYLLIEKIGHNTDWIAGNLAKHAGVKRSMVNYAGRKDRQGITRQWFSVSLPGLRDPDWQGFESETVKIIRKSRHRRKLRTGALKSNRFDIKLRMVEGNHNELEKKLNLIAHKGVPNYFGKQRFGKYNRNLHKAVDLFEGNFRVPRNKRSMYLSAARSWLFNRVLSSRVEQLSWNKYINGDIFGFHDNNSLIFNGEDESLKSRLKNSEVSVTAPLWGKGRLQSDGECFRLEDNICSFYSILCDGLEKVGMKQERRILSLLPKNMDWVWEGVNTLRLKFNLPKGCFATSVLRELVIFNDGDEENENTPVK